MGQQSEIDEWTRSGAELREVDPRLFTTILEIVQRTIAVHRDPLSVSLDDALEVPSRREA